MSATPVDATLAPCSAHAGVILLAAGCACAGLLSSRLPLAACAALSLVLALLAWRELREHAWRDARRAVRRVSVDAAGWWLHAPGGLAWGPAWPVAGRVWEPAVLLVLRDAVGARRRLLVGRGALSGEDLRRLRVRAMTDLGERAR